MRGGIWTDAQLLAKYAVAATVDRSSSMRLDAAKAGAYVVQSLHSGVEYRTAYSAEVEQAVAEKETATQEVERQEVVGMVDWDMVVEMGRGSAVVVATATEEAGAEKASEMEEAAVDLVVAVAEIVREALVAAGGVGVGVVVVKAVAVATVATVVDKWVSRQCN